MGFKIKLLLATCMLRYSLLLDVLIDICFVFTMYLVAKFWMLGVLELEEIFDSYITATLTLCFSVSLLPMPFALTCMMVNEFPSTGCVGIDGRSGYGFGKVGEMNTITYSFVHILLNPEKTT